MNGTLIRVTNGDLLSFLETPELLEHHIDERYLSISEWRLALDDYWDGIQYILTGRNYNQVQDDPGPIERALLSLQFVDIYQNFGYGPAHFLSPDQVVESSNHLERISVQELQLKISGIELNMQGVYPGNWEDEGRIEELLRLFKRMKKFFQFAAFNQDALITYLH